jgi:5-hydroxyisourate hydrolase
MAGLTTHVLDTANGRPAAGVAFALYRIENGARHELRRGTTNADGRTGSPLLAADELRRGVYELEFAVGQYFGALGVDLPEPAFLEDVVPRFGIARADEHYRVPLLVSPWSFSTYRGS